MLLALLLLPLLPALAASAAAPLATRALVGAHYFGGWCVPVCVRCNRREMARGIVRGRAAERGFDNSRTVSNSRPCASGTLVLA
jgi:hypothetical protein